MLQKKKKENKMLGSRSKCNIQNFIIYGDQYFMEMSRGPITEYNLKIMSSLVIKVILTTCCHLFYI